MKKTLILMMALMIVFVMTACGATKDDKKMAESAAPATTNPADTDLKPEAGAKLIVWEKDEKPFLDAIIKEFTAKYKIPVEFQEVAPGDMNKLKNDGPAGVGPDVFVAPHDHIGELVATGLILPNDIYADDTKMNFNEAAVKSVSMKNVLYGYPRNMETYALFYNKSLVKKEDLASWDSIIKFAKGYNDVTKNKFGFMMEVNNFYYNYAWIAGSGGYVFGKNGTDPNDIGINSDGAIEGMKFYQTLKQALPIKAADATGDVKTNLFQTGKLPINLDGIWQLGNFTKEKLGFEVGVIPLPKMTNGKDPISFAGVKSYFVSSFSKYPNAAKLFAHFVTSEDAMSKNFKLTGIVPARKGMENDPTIKGNEMVKAFIEQFNHSQPMPSIIEMRSVWGPATASLDPIWEGGDVKKLLDKAVADIKTGIAGQGK